MKAGYARPIIPGDKDRPGEKGAANERLWCAMSFEDRILWRIGSKESLARGQRPEKMADRDSLRLLAAPNTPASGDELLMLRNERQLLGRKASVVNRRAG